MQTVKKSGEKNRYCVPFSKTCKKEIMKKIRIHYPEEEREFIYQQVEQKYESFLPE